MEREKLTDLPKNWIHRLRLMSVRAETFCNGIGVKPATFYAYTSGRILPSMPIAELVESRLFMLEELARENKLKC